MVNQERMTNTKESAYKPKPPQKTKIKIPTVWKTGAAQNQVCNIFSVKSKSVTFGETKATGKCLSSKRVFREEC